MINIFYEEPSIDRWFKYDRYPRKVIRRIIRGKDRPGGVMMIALGLMSGLDKLNIPYRFNDYKYLRNNPNALACVVGKPHVLKKIPLSNPILFGAGIFSHPTDDLFLLERHPNIVKILVPGNWMKDMFDPYYPNMIESWPVGIDTNHWSPNFGLKKTKVLVYHKIRWEKDEINATLFGPILDYLENLKIDYEIIYYGSYTPDQLHNKLKYAQSVIFLTEHETQGIAYQQILSCGVPICALDRGGYWRDPSYFPNIKFLPVSSVPYWDERCGEKFCNADDFKIKWNQFHKDVLNNKFKPRDFIMENLTEEKSALKYMGFINSILQIV